MIYRLHATNFSKQRAYHRNGVVLLRKLLREGKFDEMGPAKRDAEALIAHLGRNVVTTEAKTGDRGVARQLYWQEFPYQLREARIRFLLGIPAMLCCPQGLRDRLFGAAANPH
jgi:hypothetical protein